MVKKKITTFPTINSPKNGTISTKFRLRCPGWLNIDPPTTYQFRYEIIGKKAGVGISSTAGEDFPILNPSSLDNFELLNTLFPVGEESHNYEIQLHIRIGNVYKQYVQISSPDIKIRVR